jgi:hypothetical protein
MVFNKDKSAYTSLQNLVNSAKEETINEKNLKPNKVCPKEKLSNNSKLNETFFINSGSQHKRNLSNSNAKDLLNDTFKHLSNNLSASFNRSLTKSFNVSPNHQKFKQAIKYSNKRPDSQPNLVKTVVYTTTQTNINSTNNNSYLQTENKPNTNPIQNPEKHSSYSKQQKFPLKLKKKLDSQLGTNNQFSTSFYEKLISSIKVSDGKNKPSIDKSKSKIVIDNSYTTNDLRPKSVSIAASKKKQEIPSNKKKLK